VHYLRLVVWPVGLCLDYDWPAATTIPQIVLPGLLVGWLIGMTVWAMVKRPAWGFVGAWFFVILAPTSSFIPINYAAAEHRMYLPLAAVVVLFVVAGWLAIQKLFDRSSASGAGRWAMPLMIVAGLTVALVCTTIARNADYRTSLAIWQDTVEKADHNPRAHNNVGVFLGLDGQGDAAIRHFRRAVDLKGDYHEAHTNLGVALTRRGDVAEAIVHLRTAVALEPNFAGAHNSLGNALIRDNKRDEAIKHYRRAIGINPRFAKAHNNLGLALVQTKDLTGAVHHFRTATEIAPLFADAFANLGLAMWQQGDLAGAAQAYENAVRLNPDDAETLTYFAWMLASGPSVTRDDAARAVTMARRACQLTDSRVAPSLDALAAALAADGRFSQAVPVAQRAAAVARSQGAGQLAGKIEMRLILYRAGRRYVRPAAGPK